MQNSARPLIPYVLGAAAAAIFVSVVWTIYSQRIEEDHYDGVAIREGGLALNPEGSQKGDPQNAERDLKRIYKALVTFRARYKRLPKNPWELLDAGRSGLVDLKEEDYVNPDTAFSDNETLRKELKGGRKIDLNQSYGFDWCFPLPDGSPRPAFPPDDRPVTWAGTDSYMRTGTKVHRGMKYTFEPSGFKMRLWSNGKITREPIGEALVVQDFDGSWRPFRPEFEEEKGRRVMREVDLLAEMQKGKTIDDLRKESNR